MKFKTILGWLKENLRTRRDWGVALTAFTPLALVIGRAPADWAVSIVAVLFLFDSIVRRQWNWAKQAWVVAALLLWGYSVIRAAFIPDGGAGLFAAFAWLRYIVFAASMTEWALAEEKGKRWLLYSGIAAVLFLSVDGLVQYIFGRDILGHELFSNNRLTGPYRRPILGMTIANLFIPGVLWLLMRGQINISAVLANICFAVIFLSGDRMGFILAAVLLATWVFFLVRMNPLRLATLAATFCFVIFLISLSPQLFSRQIHSTVSTAEKISSSAYGLVWKSAWDVGKTHPFLGVGMHQFRVACTDERFGPVVDASTTYMRCYTHPHNVYLEWFSEGGLVGLLGFAGFVLTIGVGLGRRLLSHKSDLILWGLATLLTMRLLPVFISTSFFNNWSAIPFWLALGWAMSYTCTVSERKQAS